MKKKMVARHTRMNDNKKWWVGIYSQAQTDPTSPSLAQHHVLGPPSNKSPLLNSASTISNQNPQFMPPALPIHPLSKLSPSSSAKLPTLSSPHLPLKRKASKLNSDIIPKCLRNVVEDIEPVFLDPATASLIPQSRLEWYLSHLSFNPGYSHSPMKHGKSQKLTTNHPHVSTLTRSTNANYAFSFGSVIMVKEVGLIMPPPSP